MKSDSLHFIPSFDSIPYLAKDHSVFHNQMKLIVSKQELQSIKSLEEQINKNDRQHSDRQVSIERYKEQGSLDQEKQQRMNTYQSFRTPKKKRKGGCVCKKTGCLKLYCQCFSLGKNCTDECSCCNCVNVAQNYEQVQNIRSIRKNRCKNPQQRKSCNCKKSQCQKKYCECFNAGLACTSECKCDGCINNDSNHNH